LLRTTSAPQRRNCCQDRGPNKVAKGIPLERVASRSLAPCQEMTALADSTGLTQEDSKIHWLTAITNVAKRHGPPNPKLGQINQNVGENETLGLEQLSEHCVPRGNGTSRCAEPPACPPLRSYRADGPNQDCGLATTRSYSAERDINIAPSTTATCDRSSVCNGMTHPPLTASLCDSGSASHHSIGSSVHHGDYNYRP